MDELGTACGPILQRQSDAIREQEFCNWLAWAEQVCMRRCTYQRTEQQQAPRSMQLHRAGVVRMGAAALGAFYALAALAVQLHAAAAAVAFMAQHADRIAFPAPVPVPGRVGGGILRLCAGAPMRLAPCARQRDNTCASGTEDAAAAGHGQSEAAETVVELT